MIYVDFFQSQLFKEKVYKSFISEVGRLFEATN